VPELIVGPCWQQGVGSSAMLWGHGVYLPNRKGSLSSL